MKTLILFGFLAITIITEVLSLYKPDPNIYCVEEIVPKIRIFKNLNDYKNNTIPFAMSQENFQGNYVKFLKPIKNLMKNAFDVETSTFIISLDLEGKQIEKMQDSAFTYLDCVKHLNLKNNHIKVISNLTFQGLDNLLKLDLSYNLMEVVASSSFEQLDRLQVLDLSHNKIESLEKFAFVDLSHLEQLDLSYNALKQIHKETFSFTPILQFLHLNSNFLSEFLIEDLTNLVYLKYIDLSNNLIKYVKISSPSYNSTIEEMDLSDNRIAEVDFNSLKKALIKLKYLDLSKNLFDCSEFDYESLFVNVTVLCGYTPYSLNPDANIRESHVRSFVTSHRIEESLRKEMQLLSNRVDNLLNWMIWLFLILFGLVLGYILHKARLIERLRDRRDFSNTPLFGHALHEPF